MATQDPLDLSFKEAMTDSTDDCISTSIRVSADTLQLLAFGARGEMTLGLLVTHNKFTLMQAVLGRHKIHEF